MMEDGHEALHAARRFEHGLPIYFQPGMPLLDAFAGADPEDEVNGQTLPTQALIETQGSRQAAIIQREAPAIDQK